MNSNVNIPNNIFAGHKANYLRPGKLPGRRKNTTARAWFLNCGHDFELFQKCNLNGPHDILQKCNLNMSHDFELFQKCNLNGLTCNFNMSHHVESNNTHKQKQNIMSKKEINKAKESKLNDLFFELESYELGKDTILEDLKACFPPHYLHLRVNPMEDKKSKLELMQKIFESFNMYDLEDFVEYVREQQNLI